MKPITTTNRALICYLVDMSSSLEERVFFENNLRRKSDIISEIVNIAITEYIYCCNRGGEYKNYFDIMIFGYNGEGITSIIGDLVNNGKSYASINEIIDQRIPKRTYKRSIQVQGVVKEHIRTAFEIVDICPTQTTPLYSALNRAYSEVSDWLNLRGEAYSVAMITNLTDGAATDATDDELRAIADKIKSLKSDGSVILSNIHIGGSITTNDNSILFPSCDKQLKDIRNGVLLYNLSSTLPSLLGKSISKILDREYNEPLKAMAYNTSLDRLTSILQIGTLTINQEF